MHFLFSDGGARGNPGKAACAALIFDHNMQLLETEAKFLGETTNNIAEYQGLLAGLKLAQKLGVAELECKLDSELIVKQVNGEYRVKDQTLQVIYNKVKSLADGFKLIKFTHVPRASNKHADRLVNIVLDAVG